MFKKKKKVEKGAPRNRLYEEVLNDLIRNQSELTDIIIDQRDALNRLASCVDTLQKLVERNEMEQ